MGIIDKKVAAFLPICGENAKMYKYSKICLDFFLKSIIIYNSFLFAFDAYLSAERNEYS